MNKCFLPVSLFSVGLAWLVVPAASGAPAASPPVISVAEPVHDFGVVAEGEPARHLFKVKNSGGMPLEIKSVSATCGCTAAAPREKLIAPGKTGEIQVSFDTRARSGRNEKSVTVVTNDPSTPVLTLRIVAEVVQLLGFDPPFGYVNGVAGEKIRSEVWLNGTLAGQARPKISRVEPRERAKVAIIERGIGAERQRGLSIELEPPPIGDGEVRVVLATGLPQRPVLEHSLRWSVRGNIEAPRLVHLDLAQPTLRERVIQVTSRRQDFHLKAARVLEGPFRAQVVGGGASPRSVKLTSTLVGPPAAYTQGKLILESNDPLEPVKEIRLSIAANRPDQISKPH